MLENVSRRRNNEDDEMVPLAYFCMFKNNIGFMLLV